MKKCEFSQQHLFLNLTNLDQISRPDAIAKEIVGYYCPKLAKLALQPPLETHL